MPKYSVSLRLIASHRVPPNPNRNERTNDETMSGKGKRLDGPGEGDTFRRKTFSVSRLADFASIPELIRQTGQPPGNWPLTIVKELADNGVDEAEEGGTAPEIEIARYRQIDQGPQQDRPAAVTEIPSKCWRKCCWQIRTELGAAIQTTTNERTTRRNGQ